MCGYILAEQRPDVRETQAASFGPGSVVPPFLCSTLFNPFNPKEVFHVRNRFSGPALAGAPGASRCRCPCWDVLPGRGGKAAGRRVALAKCRKRRYLKTQEGGKCANTHRPVWGTSPANHLEVFHKFLPRLEIHLLPGQLR